MCKIPTYIQQEWEEETHEARKEEKEMEIGEEERAPSAPRNVTTADN
jgi:hypothetical protein